MGLLDGPVDAMAELLANCVKFQEFTGSADATEALTKIYTDPVYLDKDLPPEDFYAVIILNELELEIGQTGVGENAFDSTKSTFVNLVGTYDKINVANSQAFRTIISALLDEILDKQSVGFKEISFLRRLKDVQYKWTISDQNEDDSFSDRKCGFQFAFEEGLVLA